MNTNACTERNSKWKSKVTKLTNYGTTHVPPGADSFYTFHRTELESVYSEPQITNSFHTWPNKLNSQSKCFQVQKKDFL